MSTRYHGAFMALLIVVFGAAGCGGGTDGTGAPAPAAPKAVTATGVMTKGSVILNGTRFDTSLAIVTDDRNRTAAQLANGMVIKLRGSTDGTNNGKAERIDVENEVRGTIQTVDAAANPQRFTVAGLPVHVSSRTVYASVANFSALTVGLRVEVHGLRDPTGVLRATRVEAIGAQDGLDELRGPVSNIDTAKDMFTLNGNITVNYAGAVFSPAGATEAELKTATIVEVRGTLSGSVFTATQVDIEELEDVAFQGEQGENQDIEGFITGFTAHPGTFKVGATTVQTTPATQFEKGSAANLANSVFVEAEGTINAQGVLVASKIKFEEVGESQN